MTRDYIWWSFLIESQSYFKIGLGFIIVLTLQKQGTYEIMKYIKLSLCLNEHTYMHFDDQTLVLFVIMLSVF